MTCGYLLWGGTGAVTCVAMSNEQSPVRAAEVRAGRWELTGAVGLALINDYLGYVADRGYSARTVRAYAFDLLHFARWLAGEGIVVDGVDTDVLLRYLAANRSGRRDGQPANVIPLGRGTASGFAPATINRRLAAISGLFAFRSMRDPDAVNPVPKGPAARRTARGERTGLLAHLASPKPRSKLRVREPRRLPRGLDRAETATLMGSFRTGRDRAIAGLMLLSGLRSAEVLGLRIADVDIARGWVRVTGKGDKERSVPLDPDVAGLIQSYLLAERPETVSKALFVVAKGPHRGQPLTAAGLRRVFRYHREISGVAAGHPHALRHTFGTALAESGVDLAVLQALMGHDHVESSAAYIHLAPGHVRAAYDAARQRQRAAEGAR
jgi:site-specific recombinase XerD